MNTARMGKFEQVNTPTPFNQSNNKQKFQLLTITKLLARLYSFLFLITATADLTVNSERVQKQWKRLYYMFFVNGNPYKRACMCANQFLEKGPKKNSNTHYR